MIIFYIYHKTNRTYLREEIINFITIETTRKDSCGSGGTDCKDNTGENFKVNDATLGIKVSETVLPTK